MRISNALIDQGNTAGVCSRADAIAAIAGPFSAQDWFMGDDKNLPWNKMTKFAALVLASLCSMLALSGCSDPVWSIAVQIGTNMMKKSDAKPIGMARMSDDQSLITLTLGLPEDYNQAMRKST